MDSSVPCLFVTGTGTDIGKTYTTRVIVSGLYERGINWGVVKPVASGCRYLVDQNCWYVSDLDNIKGEVPSDQWYRLSCFVHYERPVSPFSAVKRGEPPFSYGDLLHYIEDQKKKYDVLVVEGIGGLAVPLTEEKKVYDLMADVATHVVLVGSRQLGQINSFVLSWEKLVQIFPKSKMAVIFSDVSDEYEYVSEDLQTREVVVDLLEMEQYGCLPYRSSKIDWNEGFSFQSFLGV